MTKRPYSKRHTARANPRRYLLSGIPPTFWDKVRAQARKEHKSMGTLILDLLDGWVSEEQVERRLNAHATMRRAVTLSRAIVSARREGNVAHEQP